MIRRKLATALVLVMLRTLAGMAADDPYGDPLPAGAKARLGTARMRSVAAGTPTTITPDGKFLVASNGAGVSFLDPMTGKSTRTLRIEKGYGSPLAFSADGKRGLMSGYPESFVFDAESGKILAKVTRNPNPENGSVLSRDGKYLALGASRNFNDKDKDKPLTAIVWDVDANKQLSSVTVAQNQSANASISPDGKRLATWGSHFEPNAKEPPKTESDPNRLIQFWDAANGKELAKARITSGYNPVTVVFSPDGLLAATSSGDGSIRLLDPATGESKGLLLGRSRQGRKIAFSPDGKILAASGDDGCVQRWSIPDGKRLGTTETPIPMPYGPRSLLFTSNERIVVWGNRGIATVVWEALSGKLLTPAGGHFSDITSVALVGGKEVYTASSDGMILRWDPTTGKELGTLALKRPGDTFGAGLVNGPVTLSPDGTLALASDGSGGIAIYDLPAGAQQFVIPGDQNREAHATFTADNSKVVQVLYSYDAKVNPGRASVWDLASAKKLGGVELPGMDRLTAALSPDGKTLVVAGVKQEEKGPGQFIVTGWELATGKKLGEYVEKEGGGFGASHVAMAGHNKSAVVYSPKGEAFVVDVLAGTKLHPLELNGNQPTGPPVVSPDGKSVAVALGMGFGANPTSTILIFDIESGKVKKSLTGSTGNVESMLFTADGKTLISGSHDTTALVWDITGP